MTLMIELSPDEEVRLETAARQKGIAVAELARQLLTERLPGVGGVPAEGVVQQMTPEEVIRRLDELAQMNHGLPVLPPEAFEREQIYEDQPSDAVSG